jgi:hypothetical protein
MKTFQPFADQADALTIGEFTVENGTDKVSLYGSLDVKRDKTGLQQAKALKSVLDALVQALEQDKALSVQPTRLKKTKQVKNPFA